MDYEKKLREALYSEETDYDVVRWIERTFPELRESEDERIRKFLINILSHCTWRKEWPFGPNEVVAYLEKQKEQKPVKLDDDTEVGLDRALQIVKDAKGNLCGYQSDDGIYECDHAIQTLERILKNGIEQKPAEKQDYSGLNYLERAIHRGFLAAGVENVPVGIIKETAKDCLAQMKPVEWSEEDEHNLNSVISLVHSTSDGAWGSCIGDRIENWLKSLRPSWKPSEQEKGALRTAIYVLTDERNFPKTAAQLQNILNAFEGEESRKDWKPGEEQMEVLQTAERLVRANNYPENAKILAELYEQLKAL